MASKLSLTQGDHLEHQGYEPIYINDDLKGYVMRVYYHESDNHALRMIFPGHPDEEDYEKWTLEQFEAFKKRHQIK